MYVNTVLHIVIASISIFLSLSLSIFIAIALYKKWLPRTFFLYLNLLMSLTLFTQRVLSLGKIFYKTHKSPYYKEPTLMTFLFSYLYSMALSLFFLSLTSCLVADLVIHFVACSVRPRIAQIRALCISLSVVFSFGLSAIVFVPSRLCISISVFDGCISDHWFRIISICRYCSLGALSLFCIIGVALSFYCTRRKWRSANVYLERSNSLRASCSYTIFDDSDVQPPPPVRTKDNLFAFLSPRRNSILVQTPSSPSTPNLSGGVQTSLKYLLIYPSMLILISVITIATLSFTKYHIKKDWQISLHYIASDLQNILYFVVFLFNPAMRRHVYHRVAVFFARNTCLPDRERSLSIPAITFD